MTGSFYAHIQVDIKDFKLFGRSGRSEGSWRLASIFNLLGSGRPGRSGKSGRSERSGRFRLCQAAVDIQYFNCLKV